MTECIQLSVQQSLAKIRWSRMGRGTSQVCLNLFNMLDYGPLLEDTLIKKLRAVHYGTDCIIYKQSKYLKGGARNKVKKNRKTDFISTWKWQSLDFYITPQKRMNILLEFLSLISWSVSFKTQLRHHLSWVVLWVWPERNNIPVP